MTDVCTPLLFHVNPNLICILWFVIHNCHSFFQGLDIAITRKRGGWGFLKGVDFEVLFAICQAV